MIHRHKPKGPIFSMEGYEPTEITPHMRGRMLEGAVPRRACANGLRNIGTAKTMEELYRKEYQWVEHRTPFRELVIRDFIAAAPRQFLLPVLLLHGLGLPRWRLKRRVTLDELGGGVRMNVRLTGTPSRGEATEQAELLADFIRAMRAPEVVSIADRLLAVGRSFSRLAEPFRTFRRASRQMREAERALSEFASAGSVITMPDAPTRNYQCRSRPVAVVLDPSEEDALVVQFDDGRLRRL